jgi:hypothetical protein
MLAFYEHVRFMNNFPAPSRAFNRKFNLMDRLGIQRDSMAKGQKANEKIPPLRPFFSFAHHF